MKKIFPISIIFFLCLVFGAQKVSAASMTVLSDNKVNVGSDFLVTVVASTDGEAINSVDLTLDFDDSLLSFAGYTRDGTIVGLWINPPEEKDGRIHLSGIIPGGAAGLYDANKNELGSIPVVELRFNAKNEGTAHFTLSNTQLLKNDGQGTELIHDTVPADVLIGTNIAPLDRDKPKDVFDKTPPEPFTIEFLESSFFSKTPSMIVFKAEDYDSGIKEYKFKIGSSPWRNTENPQPVGKSVFSRTVTVRAYDFYGNFQDANIRIPGMVPSVVFLILVGLLLSGTLVYKLLKYKV